MVLKMYIVTALPFCLQVIKNQGCTINQNIIKVTIWLNAMSKIAGGGKSFNKGKNV